MQIIISLAAVQGGQMAAAPNFTLIGSRDQEFFEVLMI